MSSRWVRSVLQIKLGSSWEAVKKVYRDSRIPIYVRHFLAEWIETQIATLNPHEFLRQLQQKCGDIPSVFLSDGSYDFAAALSTDYPENPELLQSILKKCLHEEERIAMQDEESWKNMTMEERAENDKIEKLRGTFEVINDLLSKMNVLKIAGTAGTEEESFFLLQQNKLLTFQQAQNLLYAIVAGLLAELTILVKGYFKYTLDLWEYEKKKWFIGNKEMSSQVSSIEADAQRLHVALRELRGIVEKDVWAFGGTSLLSYVWELQGELMEMSIYIKDIPLLMTGSKYKIKIGFLSIPRKEFEPTDTNIKLKMTVVTQGNSPEKGRSEKTKSSSSGSMAAMEEDSSLKEGGEVRGNEFPTKEDKNGRRRNSSRDNEDLVRNHFVMRMDNFLLHKMNSRREGHSQGESVTDQLVYIYLDGLIHFDFRDFKFRKLSIPHVVTTNNSQNWKAWATILQNYGFCDFLGNSSGTPKSASWEKILDVIGKFYSDKTKLTLDKLQLDHLTEIGNYSLSENVELKEFFQNKIIFTFAGKKKQENYSFWRWFYGAIRMIEQMKEKEGCLSEGEEWIQRMDKYFMGFISKNEAEKLLTTARKGIFLLRFSDSTPSGISVVVNIGKGTPRHVTPFTKDDLPLSPKIISLADAEFLFPDIHKTIVFENDSARTEVPKDPKKVPYVSLDPSTSVKDEDYTLYKNGTEEILQAIVALEPMDTDEVELQDQ